MGEAKAAEIRKLDLSTLVPERLAVTIRCEHPEQQCGGTKRDTSCVVAITKVFRVFSVDDHCNDDTVSTIEMRLEFDILHDVDVMMVWKWTRSCPCCAAEGAQQ